MSNRDIRDALSYHDATKLSYINLDNKPPMHKAYPHLAAVPLPEDFPYPRVSAVDALCGWTARSGAQLELPTLAQLLFFSAGMVKKGTVRGAGEVHYRAAASAGALYPIEVYVAVRDVPGLQPGLYHFSPLEFSLRRLGQGDMGRHLSAASAGEASIAEAPAVFLQTAMFWRSAWKYRARSYRYCFWDAGTMAANLLAACSSAGLGARLVMGFVDGDVNRLLGLAAVGRQLWPSFLWDKAHLLPARTEERSSCPMRTRTAFPRGRLFTPR